MKIPLGGGAHLEPDEGERNSPFHVGIVSMKQIPNTKAGYRATLECGHEVMVFGDLVKLFGEQAVTRGRVLCTECRDRAAQSGIDAKTPAQ